ncbi:uncharacterized protein LOC108810933 isoform X2 [Raphanus sativus]|uniref:DNA-directed RNA polymerase III subunit RPC3 n=1 Tax=Raphanus sativus TaxID=3726 RepID=A0A9W3BX85_RAPSA|nr:uncharacterized protein LOC108810933 isoform X2 [Raphanus sativus]
MTATEYGIVYAVHIITVEFGPIVSKVCERLLRKGPLSLREIAKSDINHNKVKDILSLLIHHNCVQAFSLEPPDGSDSKAIVQYIVMFNNIIHRVRFDKFSKVVNEELGPQCGSVFDALLTSGRLTLGQLIQKDSCTKKPKGSKEMRDSLRKLVAARFVERVPSPEPVLGNKEGPAQKKRGAKILKEPEETLEERVLEASTPVESIRFPLIFEQGSSSSSADNDSNISEGKRKERDVDSSSDANNEVVWRPNFEELIRRLRHKACVEIVKERRDDQRCAIVLNAMLELGRSQEKKVKTDKSVPMSRDSIYEEVIKTEEGRDMLDDKVKKCLEQLSATSSYLPAFVIRTDDSYIVDYKSIISVAQKDEVESLVMKRYGKEALRMFRYLSQEDRFVETDRIANALLTEKKVTPQILMKMWKDSYLHMQKLVVTGVYVPFLLWKVDKAIAWRKMLDEMYHASLNLSLRLIHESDSERELLLLPVDKLEGGLKNRRKKIDDKTILLSNARLNLDDAIMLFHDF